MRPLGRPPREARDRWIALPATIAARARIAELIAAGGALESAAFAHAWTERSWADAVANAQDGLCAWCTVNPRDGGHVGVIDHIRPRAAVTRDVAEVGEEGDERDRVEGRSLLPCPPLRPGYHWLAYDPDNFAYSCERCNTGWKRTLWPVRPWHDAASFRPPEPDIAEDELVLDPFEPGFDPLQHFQFGPFGALTHRGDDERAEATIATLALARESLCEKRAKQHRELETDVKAIRRTLRDASMDLEHVSMLGRIAERCAWSSPHAAFYRVALKQTLRMLGVAWSKLREVWDQHGLAKDIMEPPDDAWVD